MKRFERRQVGFLSREQIEAILAAPDPSTWTGRRDRVLLATLYNTGARVSEITAIQVEDLQLGTSASVRLRGKGRKERTIPLWNTTASLLRQWLRAQTHTATSSLFPNRLGGRLSRTNVTERLQLAVRAASQRQPDLAKRQVTPHIVRHSLAMHLLQAGVDVTVIALWLGHESPSTTHMYVEADLAMKERTLKSLQSTNPQARSISTLGPTDAVPDVALIMRGCRFTQPCMSHRGPFSRAASPEARLNIRRGACFVLRARPRIILTCT
jgi:integrase/recombinase XerD